MKFNFKKITSVLASAIMLGSTIGIAAAAGTYPSPFIKGGAADVAVVVGAAAQSSDYLAAVNLGQSLQTELAKQTATAGAGTGASASGGDSVNLATSARKLYYADSINAGRSSISSTDMAGVLGDGKVISLTGIEYKYTQTIVPGSTASVFGTSGGDLNDPKLYIDGGIDANAPLYNYTLSLTKNLNVSDSTNVQGQKIKILGVDYVIGASSTNSTLYLYGAGETVTLAGGESKTITIAGKEHTVELAGTTSTTEAKIAVDGVSKTVTEGSSYSFAGDLNVYVKDVTYQAYAGGLQSTELIVGANTLKIANGASVKKGADETTIQNTNGVITAAGTGLISGFTIQVAMQKTQTDHIAAGESFTDPVFGGLKVQFAGPVPTLDDKGRAEIKIDTDNNQFGYVTFTSARAGTAGEKKITYVYDNDTTSSAVLPLLAHQTVTSNNRGNIHVLEGENALINDVIIINQGDAGTLTKVTDIATSGTECKVTFEDLITGDAQSISLANATSYYSKSGVNIYGGTGYTVRAAGACTGTSSVNITWSSASTTKTVFPRIKLKDGGWLALLAKTVVPNGTDVIFPDGQTTLATSGTTLTNLTYTYQVSGINWGVAGNSTNVVNPTIQNITSVRGGCNFSSGPAVLYIEPKKWDDSSFGNYICTPLTTTGTLEIAIGTPALNGTNSGFVTYNSDTYKSAAVDKYGSFVTMESRTNENGVATILAPTSQMYLDVLFTSDVATVTAGTAGTGTVTELGSVTVKDSEISSVQGKNLIVVGGSCINTVAAKLLGSDTPLCGADFTTATGVGADQFLVQVLESPYTTGKVAMLVAGYEAADTTKAITYVTKEPNVVTDKGTALKKVTATYADVTTAATNTTA